MFLSLLALSSSLASVLGAPLEALHTSQPQNVQLPIHNITRYDGIKFENLAIRSNGQILTTSTLPNASVYQVDPLGIVPLTRIYEIDGVNVSGTAGITEGERDVFYVVSGFISIKTPLTPVPESYTVTELDVSGLSISSNGTMTRAPVAKTVARLPGAALLNGAAMARRDSDHLLVADSFRGLIWNVNVRNGTVGVSLNDTTTKGPALTGMNFTGINGLQVHNGTMYWTNTGAASLFKVPIDEFGNVRPGQTPSLVASELSCDDLGVDSDGTAYVAGVSDILTKVSPDGTKQIIAGIFNSSSSSLIEPTSARFGKLSSDRHSLYVTTNGGMSPNNISAAAGVSRIDLY